MQFAPSVAPRGRHIEHVGRDERTEVDPGQLADEGEEIDVLELDIADALAMIRDGRIADAKTIMLLQWAVLRGPFATR